MKTWLPGLFVLPLLLTGCAEWLTPTEPRKVEVSTPGDCNTVTVIIAQTPNGLPAQTPDCSDRPVVVVPPVVVPPPTVPPESTN